jgi:phytoene synthase
MLRLLTARAEALYQSSDVLVPLLDADSRSAMQVLAEIYHRLLHRTMQPEGIVLRERVSVPTGEKLLILAGGLIGALKARAFG